MHNLLSVNYKNSKKNNNSHADMILGNRACYVHMMSLMERVLCHFLWDVGPMNVNINTLKVGFLNLPATLISGQKSWLHD